MIKVLMATKILKMWNDCARSNDSLIVVRVDTNKNRGIDFGEFCALAQSNSDLEKVLQEKHIECILCIFHRS